MDIAWLWLIHVIVKVTLGKKDADDEKLEVLEN